MLRRLTPLLAFALLASPLAMGAEESWSRLKLGMSVDDTIAMLGPPIQRISGRGFEIWTYDNGAETMYFGALIGWTTPGVGQVRSLSKDCWSENHSGYYFPTFLSLISRFKTVTATTTARTPPKPVPARTTRLPVGSRIRR